MVDPQYRAHPMREAKTQDGASVSYLDQGEGEVVVLLHGFPQSHLAWRFIIEDLSRTHRVIAPDWVGWGRSERRTDLHYDYKSEVQRLAGFLDAIGVERFNLFGHDYGGYLGLGFYEDHPARVLRLAILNSRAHRTFPGLRYLVFKFAELLAGTPLINELYRILPLGWILRTGLKRELPTNAQDPEVLAEYTACMDKPEGRLWLRQLYIGYTTRERPELVASLANITCPTAVIWGDKDPWCPPSIAEDLASRIESATLTRFPNAGHFVLEEEEPGLFQAMKSLLDRPVHT